MDLQYFKPPSPTAKTQRDFISIRSLSYQKMIPESKLQEDFYRTTQEGFMPKPTLTQHLHKLGRSRNPFVSSSGTTGIGSQSSSLRTVNHIRNDSRLRNKTSFNFDSINYNKLLRKSNAPAFFTNFMSGKSPSALLHPPFEIPPEQKIQEDYRFKLPVLVSGMENDHTYINLLMAFPHSQDFILGLIEDCRKTSRHLEAEKCQLRQEIADLEQNTKKELDEQTEVFRKEFEKLQLKEDFVKNQNENFRLQKEITLLLRDKTEIEGEIEEAMKRIKKLEMQIYKVEMYDLKVDDPMVKSLNMRNLRPEHSLFLQTTHIFH